MIPFTVYKDSCGCNVENKLYGGRYKRRELVKRLVWVRGDDGLEKRCDSRDEKWCDPRCKS